MFAKLSSHSHAFSDTGGVALNGQAAAGGGGGGGGGGGAPTGLADVSAELPTLANGFASFSIPDILERSGDYTAKMLVMNDSSGIDNEMGMPEFDKESLPRLGGSHVPGSELMAAEGE